MESKRKIYFSYKTNDSFSSFNPLSSFLLPPSSSAREGVGQNKPPIKELSQEELSKEIRTFLGVHSLKDNLVWNLVADETSSEHSVAIRNMQGQVHTYEPKKLPDRLYGNFDYVVTFGVSISLPQQEAFLKMLSFAINDNGRICLELVDHNAIDESRARLLNKAQLYFGSTKIVMRENSRGSYWVLECSVPTRDKIPSKPKDNQFDLQPTRTMVYPQPRFKAQDIAVATDLIAAKTALRALNIVGEKGDFDSVLEQSLIMRLGGTDVFTWSYNKITDIPQSLHGTFDVISCHFLTRSCEIDKFLRTLAVLGSTTCIINIRISRDPEFQKEATVKANLLFSFVKAEETQGEILNITCAGPKRGLSALVQRQPLTFVEREEAKNDKQEPTRDL